MKTGDILIVFFFLCFIDYEKSFDNVEHDLLMLEPEDIIRLVEVQNSKLNTGA